MIFTAKHDGRHKARLVADGSLTPEPVENIYSEAVSLRHLMLVIFLGELNNLELWGADIGNASLEACTHKTLFIIAGPEFEELEGFILITEVCHSSILLEVSWQMSHAWITYGMVDREALMVSRLHYT